MGNNNGLALSGGGVKAISYIGVLKAFEENNISFDKIAGTSAGSIIASLYAAGFSSLEMIKIIKKNINKIKYVDIRSALDIGKLILSFKYKNILGLNNGKSFENILHDTFIQKGIYNICQIEKKLIIPAVNITNEKLYVFYSKDAFDTGDSKIVYKNNLLLSKCVLASSSYPGIFVPCKIDNNFFVDGGLIENTPWRELKRIGTDKVLSVCFEKNEKDIDNKIVNVLDVIEKSFKVLNDEFNKYELIGAEYILKLNIPNYSLLDTNVDIDFLIEEGYKQTMKKINEIKFYFGK